MATMTLSVGSARDIGQSARNPSFVLVDQTTQASSSFSGRYGSMTNAIMFVACETKTVYSSGSQTVVRVPLMVREGLQSGTRKAYFLFFFTKYIFTSIVFTYRVLLRLLYFCVIALLVFKNGHYNFSQSFCSCRICVNSGFPNFCDRMIFGR